MPPLPGCTPGSVEFAPLDLSSLSSVRDFAARFNKQGRALDVLVCNAGIMSPPQRLMSEDGLELQFQVGDGGRGVFVFSKTQQGCCWGGSLSALEKTGKLDAERRLS